MLGEEQQRTAEQGFADIKFTSNTVFSFGPLTARKTLRGGACPEKGKEAGEGSGEQV